MAASDFGTIVQIGNILVSEEVITEFFACDYGICRGVCCVEGDSGAPLAESEIGRLERDYPSFCHLMSPEGRRAVQDKGFFEIDIQNDVVTPLVDGSCECAFCHFLPDGACLCSIERMGLEKPSSCSLYPVRVTKLTGGGLALNLHRWDICASAFEKGKEEGIRVFQFLKGPLAREYGQDFYDALCAAASHILGPAL